MTRCRLVPAGFCSNDLPRRITSTPSAPCTKVSRCFSPRPSAVLPPAVAGKVGEDSLKANLTDREEEVLRLVAQGLSNAEIATELVLGLETVKTHVRSVLAKLGVRDRVQAVITTYESGFINDAALRC